MNQNAVKTIKTAIFNEVEHEKFYKYAAHKAKDPDAAKAFLHLAEDEIKHQQMLTRILKLIAQGSASATEPLDLESALSPVVFTSPQFGNTKYATEFSVFHIAILMEKASLDYYLQAAQSATFVPALKLYEFLADWEMKHLASMQQIYDQLTEEWFEQQEFSPS